MERLKERQEAWKREGYVRLAMVDHGEEIWKIPDRPWSDKAKNRLRWILYCQGMQDFATACLHSGYKMSDVLSPDFDSDGFPLTD